MKGKNIFTLYEYDELERLIKLRVNVSSKAEQTKIRNKMRDIGFYGSDFGIVGMTIDKLRPLRAIGQIQVIENRNTNISHSESLVPKETHPTDSKQQKSVHEWVENSIFHCCRVNRQVQF